MEAESKRQFEVEPTKCGCDSEHGGNGDVDDDGDNITELIGVLAMAARLPAPAPAPAWCDDGHPPRGCVSGCVGGCASGCGDDGEANPACSGSTRLAVAGEAGKSSSAVRVSNNGLEQNKENLNHKAYQTGDGVDRRHPVMGVESDYPCQLPMQNQCPCM